MHNSVYYIILIIIVLDFLFERYLEYLNSTSLSVKLPVALKGIYNEEQYARSQEYEKVKSRFSLITASLSFLVIILMFALGGFGWLDTYLRQYTQNPIWLALLFFGIIGFASDILTFPFGWYSTFVIEERFGFNKTTVRTFLFDHLKSLLLTALIGGGLLALIVWIYEQTQGMFWIYTLIVITAFSLFMTMFYSTLIVPLFNKQKPLQEGELRDAIQRFSERSGFQLDNIFVIDGSKRSTKANAYFTGFGSKKRIVLYDTLMEEMDTEEIVAVLAHEIGHYKKKHIVSGLVLSLLNTAVMLYIFSLVVGQPEPALALGARQASFHVGLVAFGILYTPLSFLIGMGMNVFSRKNEYQADRFAAGYGLAEPLASSLKKLSVKNLSNLTPHKAYVFFHYSHPPLLARLKNLQKGTLRPD
jgi:STE24 endopeptidase